MQCAVRSFSFISWIVSLAASTTSTRAPRAESTLSDSATFSCCALHALALPFSALVSGAELPPDVSQSFALLQGARDAVTTKAIDSCSPAAASLRICWNCGRRSDSIPRVVSYA